MIKATMKRARAARAMVKVMRMAGDKECKGGKSQGIVDEGGVQ